MLLYRGGGFEAGLLGAVEGWIRGQDVDWGEGLGGLGVGGEGGLWLFLKWVVWLIGALTITLFIALFLSVFAVFVIHLVKFLLGICFFQHTQQILFCIIISILHLSPFLPRPTRLMRSAVLFLDLL